MKYGSRRFLSACCGLWIVASLFITILTVRLNEPLTTTSLVAKSSPIIIDSQSIRSWGCNRTETPFIFVHIGKAGGGTVRRRIAASALDYNLSSSSSEAERRAEWATLYHAYYPIVRNNQTYKARYCHSGYFNHRRTNQPTFEPCVICSATTPVGQALGE